MQTPPPLVKAPTPGWVTRNLKWFVALICLIAVAAIGGLLLSIFGLMKSSDAYSGAVSRAKSSPAVIAALGTPIEVGFFVTGSINVSGPSGRADLAIPVSGPKGTATLYVSAFKALGEWNFDQLIVKIERSGERIDVLETRNQPSQPPKPTPARRDGSI